MYVRERDREGLLAIIPRIVKESQSQSILINFSQTDL